MNIVFGFKDPESDKEPQLDIAKCSSCGWKGKVTECDTDQEGDWETGYYTIHLCPKCEDGGCIDDYSYSRPVYAEYLKWRKRNKS